TAAGCEHRVEHDRAVRMQADPVVGEDGVGTNRALAVLRDERADAEVAQLRSKGIEFGTGARPRFSSQGCVELLEPVAARRLGVEAEIRRSNHEHRGSALHEARIRTARFADREMTWLTHDPDSRSG